MAAHRSPATHIAIENARCHNLKNASCRIPLRALTLVTGVSGAGKTSLAFDTLYAEGQRRFVASLSTYARQFLERLPRPDVDRISDLPPAIAIERRNRVTSARSTVGTATEILDYLRLLFAKIGETRCRECDRAVERSSPESVAEAVVARWSEQKLALAAPLILRGRERADELRERLLRDGFTRLLDDRAQVVDVADLAATELERVRGSSLLLIDRLAPSRDASRARLAEAIATAFERGEGRCVVVSAANERAIFVEGFACDGCGRRFVEPRPALFSFNSPLGACPACQGFGRIPVLDRERVAPDPSLSLAQGAIAPFATRSGRRMQAKLVAAARAAGIPVDRAFGELSDAERRWVFEGDGAGWRGVTQFFDRLQRKRYKVQARMLIARYRGFEICPSCAGSRLCADALCVEMAGRDIGALSRLSLGELAAWIADLELDAAQAARGKRIVDELRARVASCIAVGLDYLTLERPMRTLAGGEAQRIQLATALGGTLTASLYVLDEPSVGLHARDAARLAEVLCRIRDQGNTLVVVEHALELARAADHVIELGPAAGRHGGEVVFEGSVEAIAGCARSLTGRLLRGERRFERARDAQRERAPRAWLTIVGARANNLRNLSVEIPLGRLVAVTGVSGSGKSSLIRSVLVGGLRGEPDRGACDRIEGARAVRELVVLESSPPQRRARSNPATVSKAFDGIRQLFASTREARARGASAGWFSFNVPGGRCDGCEGAGEVVVEMQFLDDVKVTCEQCGGRRYRQEALDIKLANRSIADVLELTVDAALDSFGAYEKIACCLRSLSEVGLGYLTLGQPLSALSSGELQRLRLSRALAELREGTLVVLDEPTTGLHPQDTQVLIACFD
ncbi:MAG TPA: excinuclease ABC subunit UvrA, partial [Myxococcota bacterium]|nr:excinuclease ABC subunit UvrA [Myxococcota bacterium]